MVGGMRAERIHLKTEDVKMVNVVVVKYVSTPRICRE